MSSETCNAFRKFTLIVLSPPPPPRKTPPLNTYLPCYLVEVVINDNVPALVILGVYFGGSFSDVSLHYLISYPLTVSDPHLEDLIIQTCIGLVCKFRK